MHNAPDRGGPVQRWLGALLLSGCLAATAGAQPADPAPAALRLQVPSLDAPGGAPLMLDAWWYPSPAAGPAPAVLLLHGCGGMLDRQGQPSARMREYAAMLQREGWHALALDSLSVRGEKELCTQPLAVRRVTQVERRQDALGALQWLASRSDVMPDRLALLGWSHGGSAVLASQNRNHPAVESAAVHARVAVAFYPGCSAERQRGFRPVSDTLVLVGLADDWTPAAPCLALASEASPWVRVLGYEGAHHGFDSTAPVRHLASVPNGVRPGQGVHVGGQPVAREAAQRALLDALRRALAR